MFVVIYYLGETAEMAAERELLEEAGFLLAQQAFAKYNGSDTAQN